MAKKKWNIEIEDVKETFCGSKRQNLRTLQEVYPEIAVEWCDLQNCSFKPSDFSHASSVKAWWLCPKCSAIYKASINHRTGPMKSGCPYCASKRVHAQNSLESIFPKLVEEFHPTKNLPLCPAQLTYASFKSVWWLCRNEHEWQAKVSDRSIHGANCPYCLMEKRKSLPPKTKSKRQQIFLGNGQSLHNSRSTNRNYQKAGSLAEASPECAEQWHPTFNAPHKPEDFAPTSRVIAWWQCRECVTHIWQQPIVRRFSSKVLCPICIKEKGSAIQVCD